MKGVRQSDKEQKPVPEIEDKKFKSRVQPGGGVPPCGSPSTVISLRPQVSKGQEMLVAPRSPGLVSLSLALCFVCSCYGNNNITLL